MSITNQTLVHLFESISIHIGGLLFVLGTLGNLMNIYLFCYTKSYQKLSTSVFLVALSIAGQIHIIFNMLFPFLTSVLGYNPLALNVVSCKLSLYSSTAFPQIAIFSLCLCVIDRYLMTTRSARLRTVFTTRRACLVLSLSIIIWLCYSIPSAIYTINVPSWNLCVPLYTLVQISAYFNLFLTVIFPITIMSAFGLLTWKNLGRVRHTSIHIQVVKMILVEIIVVSISYIPFGCIQLYTISVDIEEIFTDKFKFTFKMTFLISATQSWSSFYIYFFISSTVRKKIRRLFKKFYCFRKLATVNRILPDRT